MKRAQGKSARMLQVECFLLAQREPIPQAEVARLCGVNRSTINRMLADLAEAGVPIYTDDKGRIGINREAYLTNIRLTLDESMAVFLAARLFARYSDKPNPHAVEALLKLGLAMEQGIAPQIGRHIVRASEALRGRLALVQHNYLKTIETLTLAWSQTHKVQLIYRSLRSKRPFEHVFAPYFLEPSAIGYGTYAIGFVETLGKIRTRKVERIEGITLLDEPFEVPKDFDPIKLLAGAWGIWFDEEDQPTPVVLRFTRNVARRVHESKWHPSEHVEEDTATGDLIWRAEIDEWQEIVPWIRGWGADCEVLEPKELREELLRETRRMANMYEVSNIPTLTPFRLLWAKTNDEKTRTHPLICHMIDVAQVMLLLWNYVLTESVRKQMSTALDLGNEDAARVIAFWTGLHDLGKASPAFQRQYEPSIDALSKAGLDFEARVGQSSCHHGAITTQTLVDLLISETGLAEQWASQVAIAIGGHHGGWPTSQDLDQYATPSQIGGEKWKQVRQQLVSHLKDLLSVPSVSTTKLTTEEMNSFFMLLTGVTSVADWIGSQQQYFAPVSEDVNLEEYSRYAKQKALQALQETGWIGWQPPSTAIPFGTLCKVKQLRPLQEASVTLAEKLDQPALVIIEAPTGVGKTEAALYLADHWARALQQRGMYVAMPTMATSNQMFNRVRQVLERRYPSALVNYQLLHGNALLMDDEQVPRLAKVDKGDDRNIVAALEWFTKRKRGLLAPFGVGTVDQTLMGILQTRHFFVRLFGLSHKTVIFDEVHVYDTYMDELFYLLVRWLRSVGASVVILSATLSDVSRGRIIEEYADPDLKVMPTISYPAITWTTGNTVEVIPLTADMRTVALEPIGRDPIEIVRRLSEELREGGCAAVICNTVRRAQAVYQAIHDAKIVPEDDLILFHARFPWEWREEIENDVLARFGKSENGEARPRKKTIVVATQVIEQSLDLDFDLIISDLAPIDLIIQRIGRLHRHTENDSQRPACLKEKRALIAMPNVENATPQFDRGEVQVYEKYVMLRSWAVLRQQESITTPTETQKLIEEVYGDESLLPSSLSEAFHRALSEAKEDLESAERKAQSQARSKLISPPDDEFMLEQSNAELEEDNPALHEYRQAATRLAPPSITLICLYKTRNGLTLNQQLDSPTIDLSQEPDRAMTRALLNRKVEVADYRLVKYFANQEPPAGWRKNPWIRFARAVEFSEGGAYLLDGEKWKLKLNRKLGLMVEEV